MYKNEQWLVNWTYGPAEWLRFIRNKSVSGNVFRGIYCRIRTFFMLSAKPVKIGRQGIWAGGRWIVRPENGWRISGADLAEKGPWNMLEINYQDKTGFRQIELPVPKGKIREALELIRSLTTDKR